MKLNQRIDKRIKKKRVKMSNMFKTILVHLRMVVDCVIDLLFSWYWDKWQDPIPDLEKKYAFLAESATSLAGKIKRKELKSEELVQAVIYRIKEVNPMLNAVAEDCFDTAMSEAREADKLIENGLSPEEAKKKPFLGVPFTTKECQAVKNRKWTMGLWLRRNERAHRDSRTVELMREAGAIPVATTNLPEMLIWQETRNPVYGMTNNPHHTGRSPGGSSGAEAALSASYASTISLCSDLGGSTRMPAFYCGLFGHHPTCGTTDCKGVFFRDGGEESMLTLGFISKHAEDLAPLTSVIAGPHADRMGLDRNLDIKDIKFYYLESAEDCHVSAVRPELKRAMRTVVSKLTQLAPNTASAPEPYYHPAFNHMYSLWSYWMSKEPDNYAKIYGCGSEGKAWIELLKKVLGMSKHYLFPILRLFEIQVLPKPDPKWADKLTQDCKDDLFNKLGANGVLLMPSAPHPAPYHYSCYFRPFNFAYWGIVNVLKAPATQVPLGRNNQGLPLGIQVVAAPYNDGLCLTVAKYLEKEFGGSVLPCKVKQ